MKTLKTALAIILLTSSMSAITSSQKLYAADTAKGGTTVKELKDKVGLERDAIIADNRKLQEAKNAGDKANIEQVSQDIKNRKTRIKSLYNEMDAKTGLIRDSGKNRKKK